MQRSSQITCYKERKPPDRRPAVNHHLHLLPQRTTVCPQHQPVVMEPPEGGGVWAHTAFPSLCLSPSNTRPCPQWSQSSAAGRTGSWVSLQMEVWLWMEGV